MAERLASQSCGDCQAWSTAPDLSSGPQWFEGSNPSPRITLCTSLTAMAEINDSCDGPMTVNLL